MAFTSSKRSIDSIDSLRDLHSLIESSMPTSQEFEHELEEFEGAVKDSEDGIANWRSLFNFTTQHHVPNLFFAVFFSVISAFLKPTGAIFYGKIFTVLINFGTGIMSPHEALRQISQWCIALVILGAVSWPIEGAFLSLWINFGELQAKSIREKLFESMLEKGMDWYDLRQDGIASLMTRMQTQIRELQLAASQPMGFVVYEIGVSAAALGLGFYYAWQLTLVILATFPILALVLFFVSRQLVPAIESQKRDLSVAAKQTNTAISNINTVKAYNGQDQEIWQYFNTVKRVAASYLIQARANALQFGVMKCATVGLFVQGFWFGLVLVNKGMDPGRVYTTYYACLIAMQSIEIVLPQWLVLSKGMSAGNTLKSIMSHMQKGRRVMSMTGKVRPEVCEGDIEIKNVSFVYPANVQRNAITGVNFFFPAHEMTFIVGKSGSGKSTIGNLLMKYYQTYRGEILIDGHSIQTLDMNWVRQNITLVQQQSVLFNETVLQNIAFGRRGPSNMEEIRQAVDIADLQQTLNDLPNGLETVVGLNGKSLSGGQQQRVALARARLRDSPILILDEATSALDQKSRLKVMQNIREWRKGKTTIIITHDISQILNEEYVYVLEKGVVVEEGYRKVLEENKHGAFASFLSVATTLTQVSPRRNSEPSSASTPSSLTGLPDANELYPPHFYTSRIFGAHDSDAKQYIRNFGIQDGALSLGIGTSRDSVMRAVEIWTTPEMRCDASFEGFERSQGKKPTTPYLLSNTDPHSSFQPLPPARLNTNFDFSHDYGKRPPIPPKSPMRNSRSSLQPFLLAHSQAGYIPRVTKPQPSTISKGRVISAPVSLSIDTSVKNSQSFSSPKAQHKLEMEFQEIELEEIEPLDPEPTFASRQERKAASMVQIFKTIWPMLAPKDRTILVFGFFAAFIVAVATPVFAYILAQLLAVYYTPSNRAAIAEKWALILIGVAIVDGIATFCTHLSLEYAAQQWVNGLRVEALKRILAQPRSWFDREKNSPDRISECLDRNAEEMRNLIGHFAGPIFITVWMLGISVVWALLIDYKLTLVAVACFPVVYLNTRIFDWITSRWETKCNEVADLASSIFTETFSNIRVVRALTLESHFKLKHDKAVTAAYKTGIWRGLYSGLMFGMIDSLSYFIVATIFYYASVTDTAYEVTLLSVLKVINLLLFGIANAITLLNLVPQINSSRTTATQMLYLAQLPRRSSHETAGKKRISTPFPVVFNNLSFAYPVRPKNKILKDINLTIKPGTCTALVGPSGSGKSTITSLLLSLYPPLENPHTHAPNCLAPLTFSSVPVSSLNTASLRNYISIVAQQPLLFPSDIYENITYGLPEGSPYLTLSAAKKAASDAGIHDFIMSLQHGYSTPIGEGGMGISGGQAQRIAIARALVRKPKILILDEATSALDKISADAIKEAIAKIIERGRLLGAQGKGKGDANEDAPAVVIITHDIEMMKVAERIVVLEEGRIKETGGFNELRRNGVAFRRLIGEVDVGAGVGDGEGDELDLTSPVKARTKDTWVFEGRRSRLRNGSI